MLKKVQKIVGLAIVNKDERNKEMKKLNRKKFFLYFSGGIFAAMNFNPFSFGKLFAMSRKSNLKVKINPLAVKRESTGSVNDGK